jgi:hypothetical protein
MCLVRSASIHRGMGLRLAKRIDGHQRNRVGEQRPQAGGPCKALSGHGHRTAMQGRARRCTAQQEPPHAPCPRPVGCSVIGRWCRTGCLAVTPSSKKDTTAAHRAHPCRRSSPWAAIASPMAATRTAGSSGSATSATSAPPKAQSRSRSQPPRWQAILAPAMAPMAAPRSPLPHRSSRSGGSVASARKVAASQTAWDEARPVTIGSAVSPVRPRRPRHRRTGQLRAWRWPPPSVRC